MPRPQFKSESSRPPINKPAKSRQEIIEERMAADKRARNSTTWDKLGEEVPFSGPANVPNPSEQHSQPNTPPEEYEYVLREEDYSIYPPSSQPQSSVPNSKSGNVMSDEEARELVKKLDSIPLNRLRQPLAPKIKEAIEQISGEDFKQPERPKEKTQRKGLFGRLGRKK